jgi:hypothetical protein
MSAMPIRTRVVDFLRTDVSKVIKRVRQSPSELILAHRLDLVHESLTSITHFHGPMANRNIVSAKGGSIHVIHDAVGVARDAADVCQRISLNNQLIFESPEVQGIIGRSKKLETTAATFSRIQATIASKGVYGLPQAKVNVAKRKFVPQHVRNMVASSQGWRCKCCGDTFGTVWHNDHIVPLSEGGEDSIDNFQALCVECHTNKTARENQLRSNCDDSDRIIIPLRIKL